MTIRLARRHLWIVPGLVIAFSAGIIGEQRGVGIVPLVIFGIVPDLPRLLAVGRPHARGQLAPRAVPLFNLLHHPVAPLAVLALAAAGVLPVVWLVGALAWLGHIVIGVGTRDRLRTRDGFPRSHWLVDLGSSGGPRRDEAAGAKPAETTA